MQDPSSLNILQLSDLHIRANDGWEELDWFVDYAIKNRVSALVLCGDLFDTYDEYVAGNLRLFERLGDFPGFVLIAWGNHEWLRKGAASDPREGSVSERIHVFSSQKLEVVRPVQGVEFVGKSHRNQGPSLQELDFPPKEAEVRFFVGHGTLVMPGFPIFDEEEGAEVFSPTIFEEAGCDVVTLGHIHRRPKPYQVGPQGPVIAYAGSSRVWRRTEEGARGFLHWRLGSGVQPTSEFVPIGCAGEIRKYRLWIEGHEELATWIARFEATVLGSAGSNDVLEVAVEGWIHDDDQWTQFERALRSKYEQRSARIRFEDEGLVVFDQVEEQPAFSNFLKKWKELATEGDPDWQRARILGLKWIKEELAGRGHSS